MDRSDEIRVMVVDDHPVVRMGLGSMLDSQAGIKVVGTVASGPEALATIDSLQPDVVLMDLRMPDMDGVDAIVALRSAEPNLKVLVLTNYQMDEDVFNALQAGALGYLVKSAPQEEVINAIRTVNQGKAWIPPGIAAKLAERIGRSTLSPRETEVLLLVAKGLTNKEIGARLFISDKTVRNHVISVMDKLQAKHRTEAVTVAIRKGLIRLGE